MVDKAVDKAAEEVIKKIKGFGIEQVGSKINRGISFIIYGNPGTGKTTLATTLKAEETLIINTEAGLGPLLGNNHYIFNVRKAMEKEPNVEKVINDLYTNLKTGNIPVKNVVIDNISELLETMVLYYTKSRKKGFPELKEHGDVAFKIREVMYNFRDLVYKDMNVVFNAWEFPKEIRQTDGSLHSLIIPMIGNKIALQMSGIVDCVGRLEVFEKTNKRWLRFGANPYYLAKSQFKGLDGEPADLGLVIDKINSYDYSKGEQ